MMDIDRYIKSARIFVAIGCLIASGTMRLRASVAISQTATAQQPSQPSATTPAEPASAPAVPPPCPAVSAPQTAPPPDCKPLNKSKKQSGRRASTATSTSGPQKKVVRNGSTTEPSTAISPPVSPEQLATTNGLLAKTDENLKIVTVRQLNAAQQDTVNQIETYVKQSKKAADDGDQQRAYTLANKARMLSGDLVKH